MPNNSVTLRDVYEAINSLENKINTRIDKIEYKVDVLEGFQNKLVGVGTVVSVFISGLVTIIWNKLIGK